MATQHIGNTIKKIDKLFLFLAILSFSLLLLFQLFHMLNVDFMTKIPQFLLRSNFHNSQSIVSGGQLTLKILHHQNLSLSVHINDENYGEFNNNEIQFTVRDGDVISIHGALLDEQIKIQIVNGSSNILRPMINDVFIINHEGDRLCKVELSKNNISSQVGDIAYDNKKY